MNDEEFQYHLARAQAWRNPVAEQAAANLMRQSQETLDWTAKQQAFATDQPGFFQSSGAIPETPWQQQERASYQQNFVTPFAGGYGSIGQGAVTALSEGLVNMGQNFIPGGGLVVPALDALATTFGYDPAEISRQQMQAGLAGLRQVPQGIGGVLGRGIEGAARSVGAAGLADYAGLEADKMLFRSRMMSEENQKGESPVGQFFTELMQGTAKTGLEIALASKAKIPAMGMISYQGLNAANQGYEEAKTKGFSTPASIVYGLANGVAETGLAIIGQKIGSGGLEGAGQLRNAVVSGFARGGLFPALKQIAVNTLGELAEENLTTVAQNLISEFTTVNPGAFLKDPAAGWSAQNIDLAKLGDGALRTSAQVLATMGGMEGARQAASTTRVDMQSVTGTVLNMDDATRLKLADVWSERVTNGTERQVSRKEVERVFGDRLPVTLSTADARTEAAKLAWQMSVQSKNANANPQPDPVYGPPKPAPTELGDADMVAYGPVEPPGQRFEQPEGPYGPPSPQGPPVPPELQVVRDFRNRTKPAPAPKLDAFESAYVKVANGSTDPVPLETVIKQSGWSEKKAVEKLTQMASSGRYEITQGEDGKFLIRDAQPAPVAPVEAAAAPAPTVPKGRRKPVAAPPAVVQPEPDPAVAPEPAAAVETPAAPDAGRVIGFTTAKGSTYEVDEQGRTTRTKTQHEFHDPKDVGLKEQSAVTVYVDPEFATEVGMHGTIQNASRRVVIRDGKVTLISRTKDSDKPWGRDRTIAPSDYSTKPEVGKSPLELWSPDKDGYYRSSHPGNPITELRTEPTPAPVQVDKMSTPAPVAPKGRAKKEPAPKAKPDIATSLDAMNTELGGRNMKIADLRARHPEMSREEFDQALLSGDGKGWYLDSSESNFVSLTDAERENSIVNKRGERLVYIRKAEPVEKVEKQAKIEDKPVAKTEPTKAEPAAKAKADIETWSTMKKGSKVPVRIQNLLANKLEGGSVESLAAFLAEAREDSPPRATSQKIAEFIDGEAKKAGLTGDEAKAYKNAVLDELASRIVAKNIEVVSAQDVMRNLFQMMEELGSAAPVAMNDVAMQIQALVINEKGEVKPILVKDLPKSLQDSLKELMETLADPRQPLSSDPTELSGAIANLTDLARGTPGKDSEPSKLAEKYLAEAGGDAKLALTNANKDITRTVQSQSNDLLPPAPPDRSQAKEVRASKRRRGKGKSNDTPSDMEPMALEPGVTIINNKPRRKVPINDKLRRVKYAFVDDVQDTINGLFEAAITYARGFLPPGTQGIYDPVGNVARTLPGDIEGTLHEQGHAIRRLLWFKNPPGAGVQYELGEMGYDIAGEDIDPAKALSEGTAELVRLFITDPDYLSQVAPAAVAWFRQTLTPEQLAGMVTLQGQVQSFINAGAYERNIDRSNSDEKYGIERALTEAKKLWKEMGQNLWSKFWFTGKVDKDVQASGKFSNLLQRARAWSNSAKGITDRFLYEGTLDGSLRRVGKSLEAILEPFKGRGEEFEKALNLFAQAIRGRALQFKVDPLEARDSGLSNADIDELLNADPRFTPEIQKAIRELIEFQNDVARFVSSRSPTLAWQFEKIFRKDPGSYFPLKKRMDDTGAGDVEEFQRELLNLGMVGAGKGSVSKRLTGAKSLETLPILESIIKETGRRVRLAQTRNYLDHIVSLVDTGIIPGKWARRLPRGPESETEKSKRNIYAYVTAEDSGEVDDFGEPIMEDRTTWYEFDPDFMGEIQEVAQQTPSIIAKFPVVGPILKSAGKIVTIGALRLNPVYTTIGVMVQDLPSLITRTQSGARPDQIVGKWLEMSWKLSAHAMHPDWYKNDPQVRAFFALGLDSSNRLGSEGAAARKYLDDFFRKGNFGVTVRGWNESVNRFMNVTAATQRATNATEMALVGQRLGVDWDNITEDQMIQMAAAANGILPMSEKGRWLREADILFPLFSVPITATKSLVEATKRNPQRVAAAGVAYFMAGLALAFKNKDEEWWKRMDPALKYRFGMHMGPDGKTPLRIDLSGTDFMLGIGQVVGSALTGTDKLNETGMAMLGSILSQYFSPRDSPVFQVAGVVANEKNPLASSLLGQREGEIVPDYEVRNLKATQQWDENTGTWTKAIGRNIPYVGPKRFGHLANALTGGSFGRAEKVYDQGLSTLFTTRLTVQGGKAGSLWDTKNYKRLRDLDRISAQIVHDKEQPATPIERERDYALQEAINVVNALTRLKGMAKDPEVAKRVKELGMVSDVDNVQQELTEIQHAAVAKALEAWDSATAARPLKGDAKFLRRIMPKN